MSGKRHEWEAVALLPFIDEARLLSAVGEINAEAELTAEERARDEFGVDRTFEPLDAADFPDEAAAIAEPPSRAPRKRSPRGGRGGLGRLKVSELQELLAKRGCDTSGKKSELVERLREAKKADAPV